MCYSTVSILISDLMETYVRLKINQTGIRLLPRAVPTEQMVVTEAVNPREHRGTHPFHLTSRTVREFVNPHLT